MFSLVSLLVAAALVSQQCGFEANAQIEESKFHIDNSLKPNEVPAPKRPRRLRKFVHIRAKPAEEVQRVAGERTELECIAMGNPPPAIYWMRNGETIQDPSEEVNEIFPAVAMGLAELTSKLIISTTSAGVDEYSCVAEAGAKRDTATSTVNTMQAEDEEEDLLAVQNLFLPTKPIITYYYNEIFQEIGSTALLPCRVHSLAATQVFWQEKDRLVYSNSRMTILPSGGLLINALRWSDMGNFTCTAKNLYGKDLVTTFVYPVKH